MQTPKPNLSPIYASNSQRSYTHSGYQPNLSGSDTDVSTSTENLTVEEKIVLKNGIRQEPQGEETSANDPDISSMNTLVIHNNKLSGDGNSLFYGQSFVKSAIQSMQIAQDSKMVDKIDYHDRFSPNSDILNANRNSPRNSGSIPSSPKSSQRKIIYPVQKPPPHGSPQHLSNDFQLNLGQSIPYLMSGQPYYHNISQSSYPEQSVQEITDIPKHYLDQSEILKHLTKEMNYQQLPENCKYLPPPEYPKWPCPEYNSHSGISSGSITRLDGMQMYESPVKVPNKYTVSRSHPDLSHIGKNYQAIENACAKLSHVAHRPETRGRAATSVDSEMATLQANQMIEMLSSENCALKSELDVYYKKVSKLQKFELEIQKVHQSHEDLVRSSEKRERLERTIRMRLEIEIRRLQDQNKGLREHLESATSHLSKRPPIEISDSDLQKKLRERDVLIAQLLTQNKELLAEKERQEIELQAQRATLQEQRNHIDILDNALTNAQTNVVKLEEESRKKQVYVERVSQLQKALTSLQQSSERRLQMEKKVRLQLEKEVETLRQQKKGGQPDSPTPKDDIDSSGNLKKTVLEYEKKIIGLEAEVSKWEQRYIEESTMRQIAVDAASVPKDAKIAALERTSQESEKLIAQARTEKLKHMDELYAANRKCTELEGRIKDFESKLAEKDAMIKVLQQHSQSKDAVLQHAVLGRPPRHTRAASTVGLSTNTSHTTTTTGVSCLGRVSPIPTSMLHSRVGSKGQMSASGSLLSISSESSSITSPSESSPVTGSVTGSQKSLDEQLKELDSRLSSKDSIISALRAEKERYPSHFWRV